MSTSQKLQTELCIPWNIVFYDCLKFITDIVQGPGLRQQSRLQVH